MLNQTIKNLKQIIIQKEAMLNGNLEHDSDILVDIEALKYAVTKLDKMKIDTWPEKRMTVKTAMERLTEREDGLALFCKGNELLAAVSMNSCDVRTVLNRLADYEDAIEHGNLVPVVRCKECKNVVPAIITEGLWPGLQLCSLEGKNRPEDWFCPYGKRKEMEVPGVEVVEVEEGAEDDRTGQAETTAG